MDGRSSKVKVNVAAQVDVLALVGSLHLPAFLAVNERILCVGENQNKFTQVLFDEVTKQILRSVHTYNHALDQEL